MLTTDPTDPRLGHGSDEAPTVQNSAYLVLSEEERAKGFIRPVRCSYIHRGLKPKNPLRDLTEDEHQQYDKWGYVKFEAYHASESPVVGRFWTQKDLDNRGCNTHTTMARELAETYSRKPSFYGSTWCCHCARHRPVAEFNWIENDGSEGPTVGS